MALGLSFEEAVACCFIASTLITAGPIIFGEPFAPGWVTPALPLVLAFFMSKGFFDGTYRVETFQYMAAMCTWRPYIGMFQLYRYRQKNLLT